MYQKIKTIFPDRRIMRKYNSAEYNTLPGSSEFDPDKIFGNLKNVFIQPLNFRLNLITDFGKMIDGTIGTLSCISKLYAGSINFSDCCVEFRKRKSRMRDSHTRRSDREARVLDREARGWDREARIWGGHARGWKVSAGVNADNAKCLKFRNSSRF